MTDIICFHNPDEENGYLSNWYPSRFVVDDVEFSSMKQPRGFFEPATWPRSNDLADW